MKKSIKLHQKNIDYTLKVSKRAKRMRVAIYCDGSCVVTIPRTIPQTIVEKFLIKKSKWVLDKIEYFSNFKGTYSKTGNKRDYLRYKDEALNLAEKRIKHFNQFYGYKWNKITIKNQKTRWGSCSKKGNLNFNYKIVLLPESMTDYIIVHELCHLGEFNHSRKFWNLVAKIIPNYLEIRYELKKDKVNFY
ncbi:MAG: M48 family metallopeptidase [Candidatus Nomurabacteria bacterium]|nr:M48 family metallopeptidase [Candidatus Nomurabacteria bacterium]